MATPDHLERWRPLIQWLLAIPLLIVAAVYGIVAEIVLIIAWIAGVITGSIPEGMANFLTGSARFNWRATSYYYGLRTTYPGFGLPSGYHDPGDDPAFIDFGEPAPQSRLTIFFRGLIVIPHLIVLYVLGIVASIVGLIAWFAVLFTGSYPPGLRDFMVGFFRLQHRVLAYLFLITGVYPPFGMSA